MNGDKSANTLAQGGSDRYGAVGQTQTGGGMRPYPPYPVRGSETKMVNLPAISSAVSTPTSNTKGLNLGSSNGSFTPSISTLSGATNSAASATQGAIGASVSGLQSGTTKALNSTFGIFNATGAVGSIANSVGTTLNTTPSYNTISALPGGVTAGASSIHSIIGNANSISDLNNQINSRINSNIANTITNPVTSTVSSATYGISSIRNMIETQNVANSVVGAAGLTNIGGRVASEISNLTGSSYINGIIGYIPGATAAASLVNLVGNTMGLGGILSDIACNKNLNFDLSIDNPLDRINAALKNLKSALESLLTAFDPSQLEEALKNALGWNALQNALNGLMNTPNCQMIARNVMQRSNAISTKATTTSKPSTSSSGSWTQT